VWEALGGLYALTPEQEDLWITQHLLAQRIHQAGGNQGREPEPRELPKGWKERAAESAYTETNAQAFRRKHLQNRN
jgi:hypothetical protein